MANVATRKKSIVANPGLVIETPVANNNILNKAASQSTSLYQQCSALRTRLMRIPGFSNFFILSSQSGSLRQSTDPVTQLWDCFSLGISLCFLYELLPGRTNPPTVKTDPSVFDVSNERAKKHAIAVFVMNIKNLDNCEQFTVTDLWERHSTDGLVKVVSTVTTIVDMLPSALFDAAPSSPPLTSTHDSIDSLVGDVQNTPVPACPQDTARNNIIRELVETERKYVQDLEVMQRYATALSQSNTIDQDTIHYLFPGLNKLLNFQRKFLIRLESTAEMAWLDQRWGLLFLENEEEFAVYEPYCANYTNAVDLMVAEEQNLSVHNNLINAKSELPAFLIKPVQRICKYPLLLDSLIKAASATDYPHFAELQAGSAAAKRITDKINEAQRRAENVQTVKNLEGRVQDWKGHHLSNFGALLLDDIFTVTKSDVDREYHNNSILKKQNGLYAPAPPPMTSPNMRKDTPLLLKGRIFLNNVTQAIPSSNRNSVASSTVNPHSLAVWWRGDDDLEFFTLRCRSEEQLRQWEAQINRLIREVASRRASERNFSQLMAQHSSHTSVPAVHMARSLSYAHDRGTSLMSHAHSPHSLPPHPASTRHRVNAYSTSDDVSVAGSYSNGGQPGYSSTEGFEFDLEDEYEDYPPASLPPSGRGTPMGMHRMQSMPIEPRESAIVDDRPRARTEDINGHVISQWRSTNGVLPLPPGTNPPISHSYRPMGNRVNSAASFGTDRPPRMPLQGQISSSKLKALYDSGGSRSVTTSPTMNGSTAPPLSRSRSASQPSAYVPQMPAPPPVPSNAKWAHRSEDSAASSSKRGSGSSQSTGGGSSEESPHSSSPITPFGSSESSLGGSALRSSRSQTFESMISNGAHLAFSPPVKVKVHFNEDIFVIQVPRTTEYCDLVDKVGKKIRLCGPRRDDTPLRVRYRDEDGDMVSLGSTEDVQMAFESFRPGGQVTLFVT
ncbi:hypothetical protein EV702DRAFT_1101780 [Suillus placidus]|uniref:Rho guanine nucleotide exchange factor scd1 n=1 Tax=Suillus placidus TaxID=48579 RepID=A0A9P6ZVE6_9AGAM|nr:hypothetical protein EV702DRAFT_1101780 [Suillus placidus]